MPESSRAVLPRDAVLLGFDFGTRRIGVAVGNTLTASARPLCIVAAEPVDARFARIGELIREWQPAALVVGRPLHADGNPNDTTPKCERFARQLGGRFGLPVAMVDERYSSVAGDAGEPGNDAEAAATILRQYLSGG
ncbi:Holliday junction resolvase RuvX [Burkholderiaceae bacterium FT117]|uniref:Holliday junction resolvase RuvX n=1 Tax=Zeimonas sediminis TaxID=2944268 RepID=UPI002342F18F|nr:Holliday junction resolvase RuvX [Zeimonas sediminis]MCM5572393.1 Holliday junction resolvase RuvX [Zeimonas sediminis]